MFELRLGVARKWFANNANGNVVVLNQTACKDAQHLEFMLDDIVNAGGEGVMLRKPGSAYVNGRSKDLLKVKKTLDAEALVTGHTKGTGKFAGMMGALVVEMPSGKSFKIGTGFSDAERQTPPPVGSVITYQYQEMTNDGIPRFARFSRVRDDVEWKDVKQFEDDQRAFEAVLNSFVEYGVVDNDIEIPVATVYDAPDRGPVKERKPARHVLENKSYRYEFHRDGIHKFWEVMVTGASTCIRYGRAGTSGVYLEKDHGSKNDAMRYARRKIDEKTKKGYALF